MRNSLDRIGDQAHLKPHGDLGRTKPLRPHLQTMKYAASQQNRHGACGRPDPGICQTRHMTRTPPDTPHRSGAKQGKKCGRHRTPRPQEQITRGPHHPKQRPNPDPNTQETPPTLEAIAAIDTLLRRSEQARDNPHHLAQKPHDHLGTRAWGIY